MSGYGYERGFVIEHDPTLRRRVNCYDCIHALPDKSCMKKPVYFPSDGSTFWRKCSQFVLSKGCPNFEYKYATVVKYRGEEFIEGVRDNIAEGKMSDKGTKIIVLSSGSICPICGVQSSTVKLTEIIDIHGNKDELKLCNCNNCKTIYITKNLYHKVLNKKLYNFISDENKILEEKDKYKKHFLDNNKEIANAFDFLENFEGNLTLYCFDNNIDLPKIANECNELISKMKKLYTHPVIGFPKFDESLYYMSMLFEKTGYSFKKMLYIESHKEDILDRIFEKVENSFNFELYYNDDQTVFEIQGSIDLQEESKYDIQYEKEIMGDSFVEPKSGLSLPTELNIIIRREEYKKGNFNFIFLCQLYNFSYRSIEGFYNTNMSEVYRSSSGKYAKKMNELIKFYIELEEE